MSTIDPSKYDDFDEMATIYLDNKKIDTFDEFKNCFSELESHSSDYVYRGISNASFKMYSSSQRHWIDNRGEKVAGYPFESYKDFLSKNLERAKALSCVRKYLKKHYIHYNEM